MTMPLQPKAIHDEMNATTFDEFGRMQANLGVEAQPPTPAAQNVTLYPYVNPATELIDGTNLPKNDLTYDANGNPVSDVKIAPMSDPTTARRSGGSPTTAWTRTRSTSTSTTCSSSTGSRGTTSSSRPTPTELGWKDTVRISPLEDTIVALRPIVPELPLEVPNAIRDLNPMMPDGRDDARSTTSTRRATRPTRSPTSWSTSAGSTSGTATS